LTEEKGLCDNTGTGSVRNLRSGEEDMKRIRTVFEAEIFRLLLFVLMTAMSVWPFLADEKALSFRRIFIFFFVGWAVLIALLFLMSIILGREGGEG
jgi:hypothetical protein